MTGRRHRHALRRLAHRRARRRLGWRGGSERGSVTIWMLLWTPVLVLCLGLIVDYGGALQARALASDVALGAARAGVVEVVSVTGEGARIDQAAAVDAAAAYLADAQGRAPDGVTLTGAYRATADAVEVTVTVTYDPRILDSMAGTFTRVERVELRAGQ